jgi:hypothetical protein
MLSQEDQSLKAQKIAATIEMKTNGISPAEFLIIFF